ncbi:alpha/beta hydrolase [Legionella sp. W05-934-2]|uniref:alpha/beta hydrolase n=1 Tax=Legionella sp. W05-934-2 TaxID=1198649 RepID=UPI003462788D
MITIIKSFIITIIALFTLGTLFYYLFQRQLIYFPDRNRPLFAPAKALGFDQVTLQTQDNLTLNAWYHPAKANYPTIVHFHGNAGNIGVRLYLAQQLNRLGYGMLLVDYRGYGGNPGSPSEKGLYLDGEAAMAFLASKQIPQIKQVIFGESLGTGIAIEMAKRHTVCSLILQSPFLSLPAIARYHYPWLVIPPRDKFDSASKISTVATPLLVIHGNKDTIVPFEQGKSLFDKAQGPKQLVSYPFGTHLNLWTPDFFSQIDQFLQAHCHST